MPQYSKSKDKFCYNINFREITTKKKIINIFDGDISFQRAAMLLYYYYKPTTCEVKLRRKLHICVFFSPRYVIWCMCIHRNII